MATLPSSAITLPLSRRHTLTRMLELERKDKLDRMQATNSPPQKTLRLLVSAAMHPTAHEQGLRPISSLDKDSSQSTRVEIYPPPIHLSLKIPDTLPLKEKVSQVVTQTSSDSTATAEIVDDTMSDASSICHSPSWSDYGGKKKKQKKAEAKQREKEQRKLDKTKGNADLSSKVTQKAKRLVKIPPASKRPRRSTSTPALQTVPHSPVEENDVAIFSHTRQASSGGDGFLGGLKLKLAGQVLRERNSKHPPVLDIDVDKVEANVDLKADVVKSWARDIPSYKYPDAHTKRAMSLSMIDNSLNEKSFAVRIAKEAKLIENSPKTALPPFDFEDRRRSRAQRYSSAWPYTSSSGDFQENRQETRQQIIRAAVEADLASIRSGSSRHRSRIESTRSPDRGSMVSIDSIENPHSREAYGRSRRRSQRPLNENAASFSHPSKNEYVPQLMDEPLTPPYEENLKSEVDGSLARARGNTRGLVSDDDVEIGEVDRYHAFLVESLAPEDIHAPRQETAAVISGHDAGKNKATPTSAVGFKSAALAALSRKTTRPGSSDSSLEESKQISSTTIPSAEPLGSSVTSMTPRQRRTAFNKRSGSKIEQILGTGASRIIPSASSSRNTTGSGSLSSSSMTDRSDDVFANDFSNITTPTGSRPQSCQPPITHEDNENSSASVKSTAETGSGSVVLPTAGKPESIPFHASSTIDGKDHDNKINSSPALIRSQSTTILSNDLDFLPELKHQALVRPQTKPTARRSVTIDAVPTHPSAPAAKPTTKKARSSILKSSVTPESQSASRSESPVASSAEYLREARLSAPSASQVARRIITSTHVNDNHAPSNEPGEPIAKMFVICCKCKFFHDLPSKIYEAMASTDNTIVDPQLGVSGQVSTMVRCPWCTHGMSTQCCAGYAAVVQLRQRFH